MNSLKAWPLLATVIGMALAACVPISPPPIAPTEVPTEVPTQIPTETPTEVAGDETAADQDLKNLTYFIEGEAITLVNGIAEKPLVPGSASKQTTTYFGNEVEIDLNSDGLLDSAFLLNQDNGGSGTFFYVVVALQTADGYLGTNALFIGDRIAPQSTSIDPNHPTQFVVSYGERSTDEPMSSQPTQMVSRTFKIEDGSLVEVGASPSSAP